MAMEENIDPSGKTYGLYYQFGRKDPFPYNAYNNIYKKISVPSVNESHEITYSVAHANTYINTGSEWCKNNQYSSEKWNTPYWYPCKTKGLFDPCPIGWRLPEKNIWDGLIKAYSIYKNAIQLALNGVANGDKACYPPAGFFAISVNLAGVEASCLSNTARDVNYSIRLASYGGSAPAIGDDYYDGRKARAFQTRCVQE